MTSKAHDEKSWTLPINDLIFSFINECILIWINEVRNFSVKYKNA